MEIPKIKLITNPETKEAKSAIGYKWNEIVGTRHFLGENLKKLVMTIIQLVKIAKKK